MRSSVSFVICFLGISSTLLGRDLSGTVYSDHSGPSGAGTGIVELATRTGLISIHYQKPFPGDFSADTCSHLGAIWTVRTEKNSLEELVGAHCNGRVDVPVHSAWMATLDYVKAAVHRAGFELGFQPNKPRSSRQIVNMDGLDICL